jgi:hypothetical protein
MAIIPHDFNGKAIEQTSSETEINGATIPKGYVNLSQMCKVNPKKRIKDYLKNDNSLDYLIALSENQTAGTYIPPETGIPVPDNHAGCSDCLSNLNTLDYLIALSENQTAGTYSTSGVIIITPDNHEGCSDCLIKTL